jgi:A/G-specific adenine glycosylase
MKQSDFSARVLTWHTSHGRHDLPWQENPTAYRVWISEIMLQQTQVATVIPYFRNFMTSFPTIDALACAGIDDVLHHWSGLGYYARARNLHKSAQLIRDDFAGKFPAGIEDVVALPGIGRSTAGAILALSRNERHAILDGNVKRVLARFHAVNGWPGKPAVAQTLWKFAEQHTPRSRIAEYTQAMMDLGATVCTRTRPDCSACPLEVGCAAHASDRIIDYPGKKARKAKPLRKTHMAIVHAEGAIYLERRPAAGIWGGLWSFPELQHDDEVENWCEDQIDVRPLEIERWDIVRHSFTHFDLDIEPIAVRVKRHSSKIEDDDDHVWYDINSPQRLGIAAPVSGLIQKLKERESHVPNS